jgi:hypothetical protein
METFFLKLAVAVTPLILLVAAVNITTLLRKWYAHRPLARHRSHRHILRALPVGAMLR